MVARIGRRWPIQATRTFPRHETSQSVVSLDSNYMVASMLAAQFDAILVTLDLDGVYVSAWTSVSTLDLPNVTNPPPVVTPGDELTDPIHEYKLQVVSLDGTLLEEIDHTNLQYAKSINEPGTITWQMNRNDPKASRTLLAPCERQLYILEDGTRVWGGYLWTSEPTDEGNLRFGGADWSSILQRRYIKNTLTYDQVDQGAIAWDLIDYTQAQADLGFRRAGSFITDVKRDRTYQRYERKPILEALQQLSAVENGFDFEITPDKIFHVYYPQKGSRTLHVFEYGKNLGGISYAIDGWDTLTEVTAIGGGRDEETLVEVATSAPAYDRYGLLQGTVSRTKDVRHPSTLRDYAREHLRLSQHPMWQPQVDVLGDDPPSGSYDVGDEVRLIAHEGYLEVDAYFRIMTKVCQIGNSGRKSTQLFMEQELIL